MTTLRVLQLRKQNEIKTSDPKMTQEGVTIHLLIQTRNTGLKKDVITLPKAHWLPKRIPLTIPPIVVLLMKVKLKQRTKIRRVQEGTLQRI